ncbi:MAG: RNA polymerase sigma factor [Spirochaetaceae bacterium]|nr:RNA polymerase sigma factor [Spirochaetaceae bacterium]
MAAESSEEDLLAVHRVLAGDREAFRALVEKYGARLGRFCAARLGSTEEGEDAAQDVLLRAYRSIGNFRLGESFSAWLFGIAANRVRSRAAFGRGDRERFRRAANEAAVAGDEDRGDPALLAQRELEASALLRAVAALPADVRGLVELRYFGELSVQDAARALGLSEEAAKSRLFRARKKLREILEGTQPGEGSEGMPQ